MSKPPSRRPSKIRPVPLGQMRVPPALVTQREFRRAHADRIIAEFDPNKLGYPIINHRDHIYWVLDGQHRVYAVKEFLGDGWKTQTIDCEVYDDLTDPEMAEIFLGRDARKAISPFDKFHVACTAGREPECGTRRVVEANGLKISRETKEGCVGAVSTLVKIRQRHGEMVLGQTLRTVKNGFGTPEAFDGSILEGVALVYNRYNGRTNEKDMAARLASLSHGPRGLLRRAESQRERTGNQKAQCIAATVVDIYNKGVGPRAKDRLPSWWKEEQA